MAGSLAAPDRPPSGSSGSRARPTLAGGALGDPGVARRAPGAASAQHDRLLAAAIGAALAASRHLRRPYHTASGRLAPRPSSPFEVLRGAPESGGKPMDMATIKQVHRWLNADVSGWLPPRVLCSARHSPPPPVISASPSRSPEPRSCGCASARTWCGDRVRRKPREQLRGAAGRADPARSPRGAQGRADRPVSRSLSAAAAAASSGPQALGAEAAAGADQKGVTVQPARASDSADPRPRAGHPGSRGGCPRSDWSSRPPLRCCRPRNAA